jgi:menaquinone-dependent protoporphyrinogen IX oxidase
VDDVSEHKTLIAYATRGGTTEDYAKAIHTVLNDEFKLSTDLVNLKIQRNPNLSSYRNVIVGAGIRMFQMHKEGVAFLETTDFSEKKVGIFLASIMPRDEAIKKYVDVLLQRNSTLKPIAVEVFGGRMRILGRTTHDMTDIEKAEEWARTIAEPFHAT